MVQLPSGQCFVLLNSDFADGGTLATGEFTDCKSLGAYMAKADGKLWKQQQAQRQALGLTTKRASLGMVWFCETQAQVNDLSLYLEAELGSSVEQAALGRLKASGCVPQRHIGDLQERGNVFKNLGLPKNNQRPRKGFA